jgi:hypothetical protein
LRDQLPAPSQTVLKGELLRLLVDHHLGLRQLVLVVKRQHPANECLISYDA